VGVWGAGCGVPGSCLLPLLLLLRSRGGVGPALLLFFSSLTTSQARPRTPSFGCGRGAAGSWRCCLRLGPSTRSDWPKLLSINQGAPFIGRNSCLSRSTLFGRHSCQGALPLVETPIKERFALVETPYRGALFSVEIPFTERSHW